MKRIAGYALALFCVVGYIVPPVLVTPLFPAAYDTEPVVALGIVALVATILTLTVYRQTAADWLRNLWRFAPVGAMALGLFSFEHWRDPWFLAADELPGRLFLGDVWVNVREVGFMTVHVLFLAWTADFVFREESDPRTVRGVLRRIPAILLAGFVLWLGQCALFTLARAQSQFSSRTTYHLIVAAYVAFSVVTFPLLVLSARSNRAWTMPSSLRAIWSKRRFVLTHSMIVVLVTGWAIPYRRGDVWVWHFESGQPYDLAARGGWNGLFGSLAPGWSWMSWLLLTNFTTLVVTHIVRGMGVPEHEDDPSSTEGGAYHSPPPT